MSIKVAVRLRPFNQREKEKNETESIIDMVKIIAHKTTLFFYLNFKTKNKKYLDWKYNNY